ncbi:MAG: F0F1 ATP synthase subunit alpha [Candidatus Omnitrophota bacterium]|nr:F0F1 ATP synthase subunit alpha [Candidatus Omnitrophota bacterium]
MSKQIKVPTLDIKEVGRVKEVKYGIVKVDGMPSCAYGQFVQFPDGTKGMVMGFNPQDVMIILLSQHAKISIGDMVSSFAERIDVPVGEEFLGRIVNSLGEPLDGKGEILSAESLPVFKEAPGVMKRIPLSQSLLTGVKIVDLVIPLGKGQRELIIGDRQTGKTSICLDAIINQKDKDVICIYCWIGGPGAAFKKHLYTLMRNGALDYTVVVSAAADNSAAEQYLAPYTAAAIGEYFMNKGKDVLVVFDDLTKHAWIYRQISLLLERSPGREAYPGDIFYLHSQLLERAGRLRQDIGGGSMTFLPIVETLQGDITGYIQTNLISITDGQIYISTDLFKEGFKPSIDLGLSVSRIGSKVQCPAIKEVSKGLRLEYAQYREMLRLTKLRTKLSSEAVERMRRGKALRELLLQNNNSPMSEEEQIVLFYAFKRKILEVVSPDMLSKFIDRFFGYMSKFAPDFLEELHQKKDLVPSIRDKLDKIIVTFFREMKSEASEDRMG